MLASFSVDAAANSKPPRNRNSLVDHDHLWWRANVDAEIGNVLGNEPYLDGFIY